MYSVCTDTNILTQNINYILRNASSLGINEKTCPPSSHKPKAKVSIYSSKLARNRFLGRGVLFYHKLIIFWKNPQLHMYVQYVCLYIRSIASPDKNALGI